MHCFYQVAADLHGAAWSRTHLIGAFDLKQRCAEWSPYDIKVPREWFECIGSVCSLIALAVLWCHTVIILRSAALLQVERALCHYWCLSVMCRVCHVFSSCVLIWLVSCPRLVLLLVKSCPAVFDYVRDYPVYLSSCLFSKCRLVYSLLPGVHVCLPCLVLPCLDLLKTVILSLSSSSCSSFLPAVCTVTMSIACFLNNIGL